MPDTRPNLLDLSLKTIARVRARGPREALDLLWERARDEISSSSRLIVFARPTAEIAAAEQDLELRRARPDDAALYARAIGTDAPRTFRRRLSNDTWCYLVVETSSILHATWCTTTGAWTRELRCYLKPPPGDAYVYESFTRGDARGRGVYPFALRGIANDLQGSGIGKVWVAADETNHASRRAITKAGFEVHHEIPYGRSLGRVRVDDRPRDGRSLELVRGRTFWSGMGMA